MLPFIKKLVFRITFCAAITCAFTVGADSVFQQAEHIAPGQTGGTCDQNLHGMTSLRSGGSWQKVKEISD